MQALIAWIERGQDHLGESMLRTYDHGLYAYFFIIDKPLLSMTIAGMFFKSRDRKSRTHPFVVFHKHTEGEVGGMISGYRTLFEEIGFDVSTLSQALDNALLMDKYASFLWQSTLPVRGTVWQDIIGERLLSSDNLTAILYRKLMMGDLL